MYCLDVLIIIVSFFTNQNIVPTYNTTHVSIKTSLSLSLSVCIKNIPFYIYYTTNTNSMLATGADDQHVKLWSVPKEGLTKSLGSDDAIDLSGHYYGVRALEFHPSAPILVSAAGANEVIRRERDIATVIHVYVLIYRHNNCARP